ncbi:AAA ATPase domain protein [Delftia acidovorans]|nr:ATP-binding protein [Delftia acidovorans]KFJ10932.1 AAA ATPase domain protein [Delftia acidovorans]QQB53036.1 ATP-binding protein [Delftia acidovorans]
MIKSYHTKEKSFNILPSGYGLFSGSNAFTIIVGKNGTGKSRLLRSMVLGLLSKFSSPITLDREDKLLELNSTRGTLDHNNLPQKIICVSTSPFDKFPILSEQHASNPYIYLGLKGISSNNPSTSYMAKIIAELVKSIIKPKGNALEIVRVLNYLGYAGKIECTFSTYIASKTRKTIKDIKDSGNFSIKDGIGIKDNTPFNSLILINDYIFPNAANNDDKEISLNYLTKLSENKTKPRIDLTIDEFGVTFKGDASTREALALIATGHAKLRSVKLEKIDTGKLNITDASSGEQSVVMSMLGIASQIENNSLICIDEPEICLHPEWQERYIHLLLETFEKYRGCQFIIATHSPQLIAELSQANCFVMSMEDGKANKALDFSNRSIDFQLANVFKTPGRRNEYLNRIAVNLFIRISKNKNFDIEDENEMRILNEVFGKINSDDPLKELISALQLIWRKYGRNQ